MSSIATRGYGESGSIYLVVTRGYSNGVPSWIPETSIDTSYTEEPAAADGWTPESPLSTSWS